MEDIFIIDADTREGVQDQMQKAVDAIKEVKKGKDKTDAEFAVANGEAYYNGAEATDLNVDDSQFDEFALVINGHSLVSS